MNTQEKARFLAARRRHSQSHRRSTLCCRSAAEVKTAERLPANATPTWAL